MDILLLMPDFFDYPKMIIEEFESQNHRVTYICNETKKYYLGFYYPKDILRRVIRKLLPRYIKKKDTLNAEKIMHSIYEPQIKSLPETIDTILCIKGDMFSEDSYQLLRQRYPKARFILYQWDDLSLLLKRTHTRWFDTIYSYNIDDCNQNGFSYLPMFSKITQTTDNPPKQYDIAIVCTIDCDHRDRLQLIENIYNRYKDKYKFFLHLYLNDNITTALPASHEKLPYDSYIDILRQSSCILDIPIEAQKGPSTRFNDALATHTKVITTNREITKYPVYSENIAIINKDNPEIEEEFIRGGYKEEGKEFYDVKKWSYKILQ